MVLAHVPPLPPAAASLVVVCTVIILASLGKHTGESTPMLHEAKESHFFVPCEHSLGIGSISKGSSPRRGSRMGPRPRRRRRRRDIRFLFRSRWRDSSLRCACESRDRGAAKFRCLTVQRRQGALDRCRALCGSVIVDLRSSSLPSNEIEATNRLIYYLLCPWSKSRQRGGASRHPRLKAMARPAAASSRRSLLCGGGLAGNSITLRRRFCHSKIGGLRWRGHEFRRRPCLEGSALLLLLL